MAMTFDTSKRAIARAYRRIATLMFAGALAAFSVGCANAGVGIAQFEIGKDLDGRLAWTLFYPSETGFQTTAIGPYKVAGLVGAKMKPGKFPLVVISHASSAGMLSYHDMASYLAMSGFVVAAVEHGLIVLAVFALLYFYFKTEKGIAMRAVGSNPDMAEAQGINVWAATIGGIGLAGAFSAAGGALMVQSQGFADVNMGIGVLINGLAALMIGEAITGKQTLLRQLLAPFVGAVVYYQLVSLCLAAGMPPPDLKLATGLFVLTMLALPSLKRGRGPAAAREAFRE